ncbi:MAG: site-2 protease family protein [Candidatus Paceibacterota bacterium]|jgi:regulator of sigma E protease
MIIFDILIFILVLSIVVFVHEFGHFLGAKLTKVKVEEFGIGFPPKIWKRKIGETEYFLGALPFGGYNKIYGMDENDPEKDKAPYAYENKNYWAKALICLGGVIMNIIFAAFLFYFLIIGSGFKMSQNMILENYHFPLGTQTNHPIIINVVKDSLAEKSGIKSGDIVLSANNQSINSIDEFVNLLDQEKNKITLSLIDHQTNEKRTAEIAPVLEGSSRGIVGVALGEMSYLEYKTFWDKVFCGFSHSYNFVHYSVVAIGSLIGQSIDQKTMDPLAQSMSGPVGIFAITKVVSQQGLVPLINLIALLSVALGVSNLIPIPAMDGAKTIFLGLEAINKKVFNKELQMKIEFFGMMVLIALAVVITFKDFFQFKDIIFKL